MRFQKPWILALLLAVCLIPAEARADKSCTKEIQPAIRDINARVKVLLASEPAQGAGPQVNVGSCASRLRKLAGNFLCCRTFANTAPIWEEVSCLQLKKHYLQKSCECAGAAGGYTQDEALQDSILEQYTVLKQLKKKAISKGIPNKLISNYVGDISRRIDCLNDQTLQILNASLRQLDDALKETP